MAAALKSLFDKRNIALTKAKLRAWWDGAEFDEAEALAAFSTEGAANDAEDELFDKPEPEMPARLRAPR